MDHMHIDDLIGSEMGPYYEQPTHYIRTNRPGLLG